jgi:hypothetical protein
MSVNEKPVYLDFFVCIIGPPGELNPPPKIALPSLLCLHRRCVLYSGVRSTWYRYGYGRTMCNAPILYPRLAGLDIAGAEISEASRLCGFYQYRTLVFSIAGRQLLIR